MNIIKYIFILIIVLVPLKLSAEDQKLKIYEGKWISNCAPETNENEKQCIVERSIFVDKDFKKKIVTIAIQTNSKSKNKRLVLISPLGTSIPQGVKIGIDGNFINESAFGFNVCRQNGCLTTLSIDDKTLEKFQKGEELNLEYVGVDNQKININFALDGFDQELKKYL